MTSRMRWAAWAILATLGACSPAHGPAVDRAPAPRGVAADAPVIDAAPAIGPRPNVVLVITDDQGYGDVGAHGNAMIRTPNLDRLWAQSVRLTDFHVDPTCSPTRAALMSGRYSSRTGVWHTIMGRSLMRSEEVTLAELFREAGYRTAMFGKWHLGDNAPLRPQDQGFETVFMHGGGGVGQTPDHWGNDYFDDTYLRNGRPEKVRGYCTDVWFDHALAFIEKNRRRPFFAYLATNAPHGPYLVDEKYAMPYEAKGVPPTMAKFYGMITNIDENMGRLTASLKRWGLEQNTILIFMSDNGTAAGVVRGSNAKKGEGRWTGFNAAMRGQKGSEYDGGHRVPCFVRWPGGGIGGGRDVDALLAHVDVLPTLAELCDLRPSAEVASDGRSLAPLLRGEDFPWPDRTLFVHSQRIETPEKWRKSAVMTERWRLVNGKQLYDIEADPGQAHDVAEKHPEVVRRLQADYEGWWKSLQPAFEGHVRPAIGSPAENPTRLTCHDWHGRIVPWNQGMVRRAPLANGFWEIEVARAGTYELILTQQPMHARHPIDARTAKIRIGDVEAARPIKAGAHAVGFKLQLPAGPARLQTWLTDDKGRQRGAFYVYARFLRAAP